jgi:hypothetical protein
MSSHDNAVLGKAKANEKFCDSPLARVPSWKPLADSPRGVPYQETPRGEGSFYDLPSPFSPIIGKKAFRKKSLSVPKV